MKSIDDEQTVDIKNANSNLFPPNASWKMTHSIKLDKTNGSDIDASVCLTMLCTKNNHNRERNVLCVRWDEDTVRAIDELGNLMEK